MKYLVCGSRGFIDYSLMYSVLRVVGPGDTVIHGDAIGADRMAGTIARNRGAHVIPYPANWNTYGRTAGFKRNAEMVGTMPDLVFAFYAGKVTNGTAHTVKLARLAGIEVREYGAELASSS